MDEKTPHLHLCFVPLTADGRLSAKEHRRQSQEPCEVAGRVLAAHGQAVPGAGTG
ncbi:MAG: plasmid recombination protein [Faecalibacterium prausnitzii]